MVQKIEDINLSLEEQDTRRIKEFLYKVLRKWYWFALTVILGATAGYFHTERTAPTYNASSLILIKEGESTADLYGGFNKMFRKYTVLENHIGVLTSYSINRKTIDALGWNCDWYIEHPMLDKQLYSNEPFTINAEDGENLTNVPVYVKLIGDKQFQIDVDARIYHKGREIDLVLSEIGVLGVPYENEYFSFTLFAKNYRKGNKYFFVLRDLDRQTMKYMSKLSVGPLDDVSDMISISLVDNISRKAVDYLNELNRQFINFSLEEKNLKSKRAIDFIDGQLADVIDTLDVAGRRLTRYRSGNKAVGLSQEAGLIVEQIVKLDADRALEQSGYDYLVNLRADLDDTERMKQVIAPSVVGINNLSLNNLVTKLTDLYSRREVIAYSASEKNPAYIQIDNEISLAQLNLKETLDNLIKNSEIKLKSIDEQIRKMNAQMASIPQAEQELSNFQRKYSLTSELYTFLLEKRAEAAISHASNQPDAKVLDPARKNTVRRVGPNRMINVAAGVLFGGMIPLVILLLTAYFKEKLVSAEEIERMTKIPIIGNIIHNPYSNDPTPAVKNPRSAIAESLRELRTNLKFLQNGEDEKVISMHSTIPGEGKTFTTMNLATILAMNNKNVLLIDADLRKPGVHKFFDLENKNGLSTYLVGAVELEEIRQKTKIDNLTLISGGPIPPSPSEIIENPRFETLLENFRKEYDYIIIDNPPLTLVSDGIIMSYYSDINLYVLKQDYSSKDQVKFINYVSKQRKMRNPGIIFNDINPKKYVYAGYYGSKYNYKNSYGHYYHK